MSTKSPRQGQSTRGIVRMKDIADRGNVSLATVSRVLRGQDMQRFSQETRERVLQAARDLGWSPNRLVQSIQTGRTSTAGVIMVPFGEHWRNVMIGVHSELLRREIIPLALYPDYDQPSGSPSSEVSQLRQLMERRVDGLICWPLSDPAAIDYLAGVCAKQIPVATIDFELPLSNPSTTIRTPEIAAMELVLDHLVSLGHQRIGFVGRATPDTWAIARRNAFVHLMAQRKMMPAFVEEIAKGDHSALSRLDADLRQTTAVIAGSEQLALGVWHVAREAGLRIPRDLSIVGFGQLQFEFALWPSFTCIDQRPSVIGQTAARVVVDTDYRSQLPSRQIDIDPVLIPGETTAAPGHLLAQP